MTQYEKRSKIDELKDEILTALAKGDLSRAFRRELELRDLQLLDLKERVENLERRIGSDATQFE